MNPFKKRLSFILVRDERPLDSVSLNDCRFSHFTFDDNERRGKVRIFYMFTGRNLCLRPTLELMKSSSKPSVQYMT